MSSYSKELLRKTITTWQPFSSCVLSEEDATEIAENTTALFSLLSEGEKKDGEKSKNKRRKNEAISLFGVRGEIPG